jgi:hypothetical protein
LQEISPPEKKPVPKVPMMARGELVYQAEPEPELGAQRAYFGAFNRAVSFLPDAAINTVVRGLEAAGIMDAPKDPGRNRDFLERTFNAANFKEKEQILGFLNIGVPGTEIPEVSLTEKAAGAAGMGTAFAVPTVGAVSRGAQGASFTGPAAGEITRRVMADPTKANIAPEMVRQTVASFANRPATFAASEAAASAVASAAGEVEKEKLGFTTGIPALVAGAYTSSLVEEPFNTLKATVTATPVGFAARKMYETAQRRIEEANDPEKAAELVRSRIAPEFRAAIDDALARGDLQRAEEIVKAFEEAGVQAPAFTLAERTGDVPLRKTQEIFQQRATGEDARRNMERVQENIRRAYDFVVKTFPGTGDVPAEVVVQRNFPERFVEALTERRDVLSKELGAEEESIANETRNLINKFPSGDRQTRVERGQAIQDQLVQMKDTAKAELLKLADDLGLNAQTEAKPLTDLQQVLKSRFPETSITEGSIPKVVRDLRDFGGGMNFEEYRTMRENIGGLMGDAAAKGQSQLLGRLEVAKRELDGWAERNFGPNYAQWRQEYLTKYQIPFENGVVYKVTEQLPGSRPGKPRYALQGELVADEIFKQADRGRLGDVQEYLRLIENDVPAMNNMRNVILDKALESSVKDGTIDPTRLQTFVNRNKPVLDQLGITEELADVNTAASVLSTRATALNERTKAIKKDQVVKLLDAYAEKGQSPEEFMDNLLKNPDQLGRFYTRIQSFDDDGLVEAFRAAAMNRVVSTMEDAGPNAFADAMVNNRKALEKILTPEGYRNIAIVNDALYRIRFAEKGVEGGGIDPASVVKEIEGYLGTKIPSIGSYMRGMATNKQSATFLAALLGKNFISAQQNRAFDQMMTRAMYDTEFASTLATPVGRSGAVPGPIERRLRGYMFESAVPDLSKDAEPVEVTYDAETKQFRRLDSGEPMRVRGQGAETPMPRGIPEFDTAPKPPRVAPTPPPAPPAPAAVPTVPAVPTPEENVITVRPQQRSTLDYEMLFPNDMLGSMISRQG